MKSTLLRTHVSHVRGTPVRHTVRHSSTAWLVDVGALGARSWPTDLPAAGGRAFSFRASDHLGDPENTWYDNILAFGTAQGVDLSGHQVVALTTARALGYAFNPLTVYWCLTGGQVRHVIAEVHNTYGERHAYLVSPDETGQAETDKQLYVSPFNDVSGRYRMSVPYPGRRGVDVRITLHRNTFTPFVTRWRGTPARGRDAALPAVRAVFTPRVVAGLIRAHGVWLWLRRLPISPRPQHVPQESA